MNRSLVGVMLLVIIGVMMFSMMQSESSISATKIEKTVRVFDLGEQITIYELPDMLTEEQEKFLATYATNEFFQDDLPDDYITKGQRDLLAEQNATVQQTGNLTDLKTTTTQTNQSEAIVGVSVSQLDASRTSASLVETAVNENVHARGSIVKIAGKIEKADPPPYFYNVHVTCCEMSTFRAYSAVETDNFGNFIVKIATGGAFPLGDWKVTISTIGDDLKIIKHFYNFKLIDPT